jgi:hypothetical protein
MLITKLKDTYINEPGFDRVAANQFPGDGTICGSIKFPDDEVVVFVNRNKTDLMSGLNQTGAAPYSWTSTVGPTGWKIFMNSGAGSYTSKYLYKAVPLTPGLPYTVTAGGVISGSVGGSLTARFLDSDNNIVGSIFLAGTLSSSSATATIPVGAVKVAVAALLTTASSGTFILTSFSSGADDEIGKFSASNTYTKVLSTETLVYIPTKPIKGVGVFDSFGNKVIAWTDENTDPRILNITILPFAVDASKQIIDESKLVLTLLFPQSNAPIISADASIGGSCKTGAYYIAVAYEDTEKTITEFHLPYGPIYINDEAESVSPSQYDGCLGDQGSNKGIKIVLSSADARYPKAIIAIIHKANSQISVKGLTDIVISGTTTVIYTGTEIGVDLTLQEIVSKQPNYTTVRDLAVLGDTLYAANLKTDPEIDYQAQANNIIVNYRVKLNFVDRNSAKIGNDKGFMPGQPAALYIRWILNNGKVTRAFHIPGRQELSADKTINSAASAQGILNPDGSTPYNYQVADTTNKNGQAYTSSGTEYYVSDLSKSNMGFWENVNELYPAGFPAFAGQRVRHHTFPTIEQLRFRHYSANTAFGISAVPRLEIDVSNIQLTSELSLKAIGYEILTAEVQVESATVLALDQLLYAAKPAMTPADNTFDNIVWSGAGNWRVLGRESGESDGGAGDWTDFVLRTDFIRCHAFDLMKNKPAISPTHIRTELLWRKTQLNKAYKDFGSQGGRITAAGKDIGKIAACVVDTTDTFNCVVQTVVNQLRKVSSNIYLPPNTILDQAGKRFVQLACEETLLLELPNNSSYLDVDNNNNRMRNFSPGADNGELMDPRNVTTQNGVEESYLIAICQLKTDVFVSFHTQVLMSCSKGRIIPKGNTSVTELQGDCFSTFDSYVTSTNTLDDNPNPLANNVSIGEGILAVRRHITIARNNCAMRHIDPAVTETKYYPKVDGNGWVSNPNTNSAEFVIAPWNCNVIKYNEDFSSKPDLLQTEIYYPGISQPLSLYPNRIIRSAKFARTGNIIGAFRTFLEEEFYEANLARGPINNLAVLDDIMLIHHRYGLFRTIGKDGLKVGTTEVYLGQRGLFDLEPKEQIPAELGYLGNQHKFGTIVFKGGYAFADCSQGKIFLASTSTGVIELSNQGLRQEFITRLRGFTGDSPFNGSGLSMAYDEKYDRLLIIRSGAINSPSAFTISYSFVKNGFVHWHDYNPRFIAGMKNRIISSRDTGKVYQHDSTTKKCIFYDDDVILESRVVVVFNPEIPIDKLFMNINWITHIINAAGNLNRNITFTKIRVKSSYQDTGDITLTPYINLQQQGNIRKENNTWNFNKFRANASSPKNARFVDKYIEVILYYNNAKNLDNTQNTLFLYDIDFQAIKAER